jgi:hypothetical protein
MKSVSNHEDSVLEMLRTDENFALEYLVAALEEIDEEGGESVFLTAVRRVVEARGGEPLSPTQPDSIEGISTDSFQQMGTQAFLRY